MPHPNKSFLSSYHEGAANLLAGRSADLDSTLLRLHQLNPDLDIPYYDVNLAQYVSSYPPTLNDLASILRRNELRHAGKRKVGNVP